MNDLLEKEKRKLFWKELLGSDWSITSIKIIEIFGQKKVLAIESWYNINTGEILRKECWRESEEEALESI